MNPDCKEIFETAEIKPETEPITETAEELEIPERKMLSFSERLALHVIGQLALSAWFTSHMINLDEQALHWLYRDIADAIHSGFPHMDMVEVQSFHDAVRTRK